MFQVALTRMATYTYPYETKENRAAENLGVADWVHTPVLVHKTMQRTIKGQHKRETQVLLTDEDLASPSRKTIWCSVELVQNCCACASHNV